jgi:hypothetical protein
MPAQTPFREFLAGRAESEAILREFLRARTEWVAQEFKEAGGLPKYQLRNAVSAFSNRTGGDVFLGVRDGDREPVGTPVEPTAISQALNQSGVERPAGYVTDLVTVVDGPVPITLVNGRPILWIAVRQAGYVSLALDDHNRWRIYDRPGAETVEVTGLEAIELFRHRTRARLLVALYERAQEAVERIPAYFTVPGDFTERTVGPVRRIVESDDWTSATTTNDRGMLGPGYLAPLLDLPADIASWSDLPYNERESRIRMRRLADIPNGVLNLRRYLEAERLIPASST